MKRPQRLTHPAFSRAFTASRDGGGSCTSSFRNLNVTHTNMFFPPARLFRSLSGFASLFVFILLFGARPVSAIDFATDKTVWKMLYGVKESQINETGADVGWLGRDDDGDGISNGVEIAAGTNPFNPGSAIKVTSITADASNVYLTFPTMNKKQYVAQQNADLTNAAGWAAVVPTVQVMGDGTSKTLTVPRSGSNVFYRVVVQDIDTDGDGMSDWAETVAGYNPNSNMTNGSTLDGTALPNALSESNVITVSVAKANATQPLNGEPALETGSIVVTRTGPLKFASITVPLQKLGSAVEGVDYDSLPNSITFTAQPPAGYAGGQNQYVLTVNPRANGGRRTNVTTTVKVVPGGGYTVAGSDRGSVVINPADLQDGTGLTGKYFNQADPTYTPAQTNIFAGTPNFTRIDGPIDFPNAIASVAVGNPCVVTTARPHEIPVNGFATIVISGVTGGTFTGGGTSINTTLRANSIGPNTFTLATTGNVDINCTVAPTSVASSILNGTNGWSSLDGPVGMTGASGGFWSVRWTGQVVPKYSETYYFDVRSTDGAVLKVNGQTLVDRWSQGLAEFANSITLKAGIPYDIQLDYWNAGHTAEARLYWWSTSQVKEVIPKSRLYPEPVQSDKVTAIISSLDAVGYVGVPFAYRVAAPNIGGTTTFSLDAESAPLPAGLSISNSGVISGTPTAEGVYNVAINSYNGATQNASTNKGSSVVTITIFPAGGVTRETLSAAGNVLTSDTIAAFDDDTDYASNTSRRLRGYFVPPKTGNYYFWLAANNTAELWIGTDAEYLSRVRRAKVTASTGNKIWNTSTTQQTPWLAFVAGKKYYIEVLQNTGADSDDYVNVGWVQDDIGTIPSTVQAPNPTGAKPLIPNGGGTLAGYPLSGTVPGYVFQPYDYPSVTAPDGTLYSANLGPQGAATTNASGSANLRLNAAGTQAVLHFAYQNLGSPRTAYHLHVDAFGSHPQGEIIFDIDDADKFHPETIGPDGGYTWDLAATGTFPDVASIRDAIQQGKVYLNVHSVNYPAGEIRGNLTLVDGSQTAPIASQYPEPSGTDSSGNDAHAARFLNQATFGASPSDVAYVKANGFQAWIDAQLALPPSQLSNDVVAGITSNINSPYPSTLFTDTWWKYSITGPDQLRQRLAFAMSEIMVVSWNNDSGPLQNNGRILADYYDQLINYCLPTTGVTDSGNFRGILKAVTLTPAMGLYLDMRGNQKGDDTIGRHPNENYAREIMQLFSVGLNRRWDDGKFVLDSNANLVATYTQPTILGLSALLTGWNYNQANQGNGRAPTNFGPGADYLNPMVLVPVQHDLNAKLLLDNVIAPPATGRTPRVNIQKIDSGPAAIVTTQTVHGLQTGDSAFISGVTSGTYTGGLAAINTGHVVTVTSPTTFTVPVAGGGSGAAGTVTGANVAQPSGSSFPGAVTAITGSQSDSVGTNLPHPYDQYGLKELDLAIDNIVANENVPPYICRQLIQRLVTSTPSAGYLFRVVQKFKDNGSGVRGDMAAVVKQILLDGEARSSTAAFANSQFGKQREPMVRLTGPARAFPAVGYTGTYTQLTGINSHRLRITTTANHDFSPSFAVSLDFRGNYSPSGQTLLPGNVPTSAAYTVQNTTAIAQTHVDISGIAIGSGADLGKTIVTTSAPHGLTGSKTIWFFGLSGKFSDASINSGGKTATSTGTNTFTVPITTTYIFQVQSVSTGNPCTVTTVNAHGLPTGTTTGVQINGIQGGTFSGGATSLNGTNFTVTRTGANTFTVASSGGTNVNCTVAPTGYTTWRESSNPVVVTTQVPHGLTTGDTVTISGVSGGSFTPTINGTFNPVTVINSTSFSVASSAASPSTINTGSVTSVNGGTVLDVNATGMVNATYTQTAGSSSITVSTQGPQTDVAGPSGTIKSKVYLTFLSQTNAGGGSTPSSGIYDVQTTTGSTSFTITAPDTLARTGQVLMPKIPTSYTPQSGNVVQFNNNVNHNLSVGDQIWVDVPVVVTPLADGAYTITQTLDEDHIKTANKPDGYSAAAAPSGSNNSVNLYPLVPAPTGRSGNVVVNQSTFNLGSTETTLTQTPMNSPTVFNYFFPDYKFPGSLSQNNVDSPEFQLTTDSNVVTLSNAITNMIIGTGGSNGNVNGLSSFNNGSGSVVLDIGSYMTTNQTDSATNLGTLADNLANLLIGGPLEAATRTQIVNFVSNTSNFPYTAGNPTNTQKRDRVRAIIHLILTSAEYAVQK